MFASCSYLDDIRREMADSWVAYCLVKGSHTEPENLKKALLAEGITDLQDYIWIQSLTEMMLSKPEKLRSDRPLELVGYKA